MMRAASSGRDADRAVPGGRGPAQLRQVATCRVKPQNGCTPSSSPPASSAARRPRRTPGRQVRGLRAHRHPAPRGGGRPRPGEGRARISPPPRGGRRRIPCRRSARLPARAARKLTTGGGACANSCALLRCCHWPLACLARPAPRPAADAQREPELERRVEHAIEQAECFEDRYDSAVWYKMMEPRLRNRVPDRDERMEHPQERVLRGEPLRRGAHSSRTGHGHHRRSKAASIATPSRTRAPSGSCRSCPSGPKTRHASPPAGPRAGKHPHGLRDLPCLLKRENNNIARALARYNGSTGKRWYSDKVIDQWITLERRR